jgi:DNA-binding MurR/RpiR family transcriptional regulator
LANRAGVSTGAIVQFCKALRLKGLPALKIALARDLAEPVFAFPQEGNDRSGSTDILHRVFQEHLKSLNQTLQLNSVSSLNAAAGALLKARRIVLFSIGLSYPVAYSLYARLRFLGLPAFIEYDSHLQLAAAAEMHRGEVAIGFSLSGSTSETVECLHVSHMRNAKTICITNSVDSPLARAADIKLYAAPSEVKYFQAPLASRVTQLALADALLVIVGLQRKQKALTHLRRAEEHLLNRRIE